MGVDTFAGTNRDVGLDLQVGSDGSLYIAGSFRGAIDFNTDPLLSNTLENANAFNSGFVARYRKR